MTNNEIKETLRDASAIVNMMDKKHIRELLTILLDARQKKNDCAFFIYMDMKKAVKKLISDLIKTDHVNNKITRRQLKHIYAILGDYNYFTDCRICDKPIKITTDSLKHETQSQPMIFTWDHIKPKSQGGSFDLANLQPTHKICNNKRGVKPLYKRHYKLKIKIKINIETIEDNPKYRPSRFGLRKQDGWCHKQCCQHCR